MHTTQWYQEWQHCNFICFFFPPVLVDFEKACFYELRKERGKTFLQMKRLSIKEHHIAPEVIEEGEQNSPHSRSVAFPREARGLFCNYVNTQLKIKEENTQQLALPCGWQSWKSRGCTWETTLPKREFVSTLPTSRKTCVCTHWSEWCWTPCGGSLAKNPTRPKCKSLTIQWPSASSTREHPLRATPKEQKLFSFLTFLFVSFIVMFW